MAYFRLKLPALRYFIGNSPIARANRLHRDNGEKSANHIPDNSCIDPSAFSELMDTLEHAVDFDFCTRAGLLPFARAGQCAVEEFGGGAVGATQIAPAGAAHEFVGEDYLFERDFLCAEFCVKSVHR